MPTSSAESPTEPADQWDWERLRRRGQQETLRILRNPTDAEDATQQALVRAWRGRASCHTPERPDAWFATIARNEAIRLLHDRRRRVATPLDQAEGQASISSPLFASPSFERIDLLDAIARAPVKHRQLLMLRYLAQLSPAQIADALDINPATVRVQLHRARKDLLARLR